MPYRNGRRGHPNWALARSFRRNHLADRADCGAGKADSASPYRRLKGPKESGWGKASKQIPKSVSPAQASNPPNCIHGRLNITSGFVTAAQTQNAERRLTSSGRCPLTSDRYRAGRLPGSLDVR